MLKFIKIVFIKKFAQHQRPDHLGPRNRLEIFQNDLKVSFKQNTQIREEKLSVTCSLGSLIGNIQNLHEFVKKSETWPIIKSRMDSTNRHFC